ncbi:YdiU family protein [Kocuria coralli]|uniref:Protein nucleotidyltransferase YdiU n=1 Tax=Kocuria coralli TaxID=1461025 RepID=A0A5J5KZQ9_9MICC|nr:YdiU family protein [Kocuria coralli]KAA9394830.1 YdiU family protein [Kocuria coralli]
MTDTTIERVVRPELEHSYAEDIPQLSVRWRAEQAPSPFLVATNDALAGELGIEPGFLRSPEGLSFLSGQLPDAADGGAATYAQAYSGHQFGQFNPQLGDGRALLIGEVIDRAGDRRDLHLKGTGRTPFSRSGDGKAPLGPMLREYLVGEAMHALGIPTTRGLGVVLTGQEVMRRGREPGAIFTRVAASHLRVGTFQFAAVHRPMEVRRALADYAIARHWPAAADAENPYLELLRSVTHAQAELIAQWMLVGFVHGVMNTDNMTISGEGIDYGPCAFIDTFRRASVFSSIDQTGRYAYRNQPAIGLWNLSRFAETLVDLIDASDPDAAVESLTQVLYEFEPAYDAAVARGMAAKLGIGLPEPEAENGSEALGQIRAFTERTLDLLEAQEADFTLFFRALTAGTPEELIHDDDALGSWSAERDELLQRWSGGAADVALMQRSNPVYIPRNHHLESALQRAEGGDLDDFHRLLAAVRDPFRQRPEWAGLEGPGEASSAFVTFCGT